MKNLKDFSWLMIYGIIVAVFLYPFFHECGHMLAIVCLGGKILDFNLFPIPNVLSDISCVSDVGLAIVGLSGIYLPFFLSLILNSEYFVSWYGLFVFRGIVLCSIVVSLIELILYNYKITTATEDITVVVSKLHVNPIWLYILFLVSAFIP